MRPKMTKGKEHDSPQDYKGERARFPWDLQI